MSQALSAKVVIYADERREDGERALDLLLNGPREVVHIPMSGGVPFATYGRRKYVGVTEIEVLAKEIEEACSRVADGPAERAIFENEQGMAVEAWLVRWRAGKIPKNGHAYAVSYWAALLENV